MKKLNTYLMGMMSVAVCLFSVACSGDDEENTPQKNSQEIAVEAIFANGGLTRAAIDGDGKSARPMTFEIGDKLRLIKTDNKSVSEDFTSKYNVAEGTNKKIFFYGTLPEGELKDYTAYLISSGSKWSEKGSEPSMTDNTIGTACATLDAAFKKDAVISGTWDDKKSAYVLELRNAFLVNESGKGQTFYYGAKDNDTKPSSTLENGYAVAVAAGTYLKQTQGKDGTEAEINTVYKIAAAPKP